MSVKRVISPVFQTTFLFLFFLCVAVVVYVLLKPAHISLFLFFLMCVYMCLTDVAAFLFVFFFAHDVHQSTLFGEKKKRRILLRSMSAGLFLHVCVRRLKLR